MSGEKEILVWSHTLPPGAGDSYVVTVTSVRPSEVTSGAQTLIHGHKAQPKACDTLYHAIGQNPESSLGQKVMGSDPGTTRQ